MVSNDGRGEGEGVGNGKWIGKDEKGERRKGRREGEEIQ